MAVYNVTNATELQTAIGKAVGGDKIVLADGNYGSVWIQNKNPSSTITIQAANPGTSVHFDGLTVRSSANLSFSGIDVGRTLSPTEPEWTQLSSVVGSSNIKFDGMKFHGSLDGNPANDGIGIQITNVTGFSVTNSLFTEGYRGIVAIQSKNINIKDNEFTLLRSDGVISAANDGIMIDNNRFSNFHPVLGDHADAIQFFNTGQNKGQTDITIQNNVIIQTYFSGVETTGIQGIWLTSDDAWGFKNILIKNNFVYSNDMYNGLCVMGGTDVQVIGNTVLSNPTDGKQLWIRMDRDTNLLLQDNVTDNILLGNLTNLVQDSNINFAATPAARGQFANLLDPTNIHNLVIPGVGYQIPTSAPASPVSSAVGSGISDLLSLARGSSVGSSAILDAGDSLVLDGARTLASPVAMNTAPHEALFSAVPHAGGFSPVRGPDHMIFDHFTALP